jgi:hypothetical protein
MTAPGTADQDGEHRIPATSESLRRSRFITLRSPSGVRSREPARGGRQG